MAPSPSFASTVETPGREPEPPRAARARPDCPVCGASSEGLPDVYGVHRCPGCAVEFRPPLRVPIRRVGVSTELPAGASNGWIGLIAVGALIIGLAIAAGDSQAPPEPPPFAFDASAFEPPSFEPLSFEQLDMPGLTVKLEHEVHVSQISPQDLFLTGLIRNASPHAVEAVTVEVRCLDSAGALIETRAAISACAHMDPGEVCAWGLDDRVPGVAGFELDTRARRSLGSPGVELRARFDSEGRRIDTDAGGATGGLGLDLALDLARGQVSFELEQGRSAFDVAATVVSFDAGGQVRSVEQTKWPGMVPGGLAQTRPVVIGATEGIDRYELRISSMLVVDAPMNPSAPQG